jgi:hypothetical protein
MDNFIDDVLTLFPNNQDLLASKTQIKLLRTMNPKLMLTLWKEHVNSRYQKQIDCGNLDYFLDPQFDDTLSDLPDAVSVIEVVNRFKVLIRQMTDDNKQVALKYIRNLSKLSDMCCK